MSAFEVFFSFYGLILGLSVVEALGGFGRALRGRTRVRLGWLTPLLAIFVMLDITSFWSWAWRDFAGLETVSYGVLIYGLAVAATYYLSTSTLFPDALADWPDMDAYYDGHKKWVLSGVTIANLGGFSIALIRGVSKMAIVWNGLFIAALLLLIFIRNRRINLILLAVLIAQYLCWGWLSLRP